MISAKKSEGTDDLLKEITQNIPFKTGFIKNKKQLTDKDIIFQISEITREKIFHLINKEIPYSVIIESSIKKRRDLHCISKNSCKKKITQVNYYWKNG